MNLLNLANGGIMFTVALRVWIYQGYRVAERVMYELAYETSRELELVKADSDGLYYFVCKEQFPDLLEGAHSAADHLANNLPHVYNTRPDFQIVFKDDQKPLGWETPLMLAVRMALAGQEKDQLLAKQAEEIALLKAKLEAPGGLILGRLRAGGGSAQDVDAE